MTIREILKNADHRPEWLIEAERINIEQAAKLGFDIIDKPIEKKIKEPKVITPKAERKPRQPKTDKVIVEKTEQIQE